MSFGRDFDDNTDKLMKMVNDNARNKRTVYNQDQVTKSTHPQKITKARGSIEKRSAENLKKALCAVSAFVILTVGVQACSYFNNKSIGKMAQNLDKNQQIAMQVEINKNAQLKSYLESNKEILAKHTTSILKAIDATDPLSKEKIETQIELIVKSTFMLYSNKPLTEINSKINEQILEMYQDVANEKIYLYYDHKNDDKEPHIAGLKYSDEIRELMKKK